MEKLEALFGELKSEHGTYQSLRERSKVFSVSFLCEIIKGTWLPSEKKLLQFCKEMDVDEARYLSALRYSKMLKDARH